MSYGAFVLHTGRTDVRVLLPADGGSPLPSPQSRGMLPGSCGAAVMSPSGACLATLLHQGGARQAAAFLMWVLFRGASS